MNEVEQALKPVLNLIFYHFNCSEGVLKFHHVFLCLYITMCCMQSIIIQNEFLRSNSVLRYSQIQTLLKINCWIAAICTFRVTQHYQICSLSFRTANSMQCALPIYRQFPGSAQLNAVATN